MKIIDANESLFCRPASHHKSSCTPLNASSRAICAFEMFRNGGSSMATDVGQRRRIHTTFEADKSELIEEYDLKTRELVLRKLRRSKPFGGVCSWDILQGEEAARQNEPGSLAESSTNVRAPAMHAVCLLGLP